MSLFTTIDGFIDALVHASVRGKQLEHARHRLFIAPRLLGGLAVLAALPLYLAFRGAPDAIEVFVFAWFVTPVALACYLARTGRYESACIASSVSLAALVAIVVASTGSLALGAALVIAVPLEAALSASRRVIGIAVVIATALAVALGLASQAGLLAGTGETSAIAFVGIVVATLYAGGIAFGAAVQAGVGTSLLSSEEERYRLLARYASEVISRHGRNGDVMFMSPVAEEVFGAPAGTLLGHGLFERVHVADRPIYLKALTDAAHGDEIAGVEFRARRDAGARARSDFIWLEMRCCPLDKASTGGACDVVAAMRDVTGRKTQEDQLNGARAEAERANAAKSRFLATMSHELRTPLNAIIGFSEMIMREQELGLDATRRHEYSHLINKSGQHLLSVVNDVLDMSKIESGTLEISAEPFAPRDPILTCCELMVLKARDGGVALNARVPDALPMMVGDRRALKQVLLNLLSNAIKFTGRDGTVTVSAAVEGASLVLTVEDTGVGIGAEDLKRLGDPFFQAGKIYHQRRHEGTGLGLSIVKGLVALQGGELSIQSRVDAGTKVTVRIPLVIENARKAPATVATLTPAPRPVALDTDVKKSA